MIFPTPILTLDPHRILITSLSHPLQARHPVQYHPQLDFSNPAAVMLFSTRLSSALLLTLAFAGIVFAAPTATLQPWQVSNMNINGPGPIGIPGATGTSPANVTLSFDFYDPNTLHNTICGAKYLPADHPTALSQIHCKDTAVTFYFTPPYTFFGGNFTLAIELIDSPAAVPTTYAGSVYVLDNDYTSPADYLNCYEGAPYAGITCTPVTASESIPVNVTSVT